MHALSVLTGRTFSEDLLHIQTPDPGTAKVGETVALCTPKYMLNGRADHVLYADYRPQKIRIAAIKGVSLRCVEIFLSQPRRLGSRSNQDAVFDEATRELIACSLSQNLRFACESSAISGVDCLAPPTSAGCW